MAIVLDAGGLIAIDNKDRRVGALLGFPYLQGRSEEFVAQVIAGRLTEPAGDTDPGTRSSGPDRLAEFGIHRHGQPVHLHAYDRITYECMQLVRRKDQVSADGRGRTDRGIDGSCGIHRASTKHPLSML